MDKRKTVVIGAIVMVVLAIVGFLLPELLRVEMVSSMGILAANNLTMVMRIASAVLAVVAVGVGWRPVRQAIGGHLAKKAALAPRQTLELPPADESNPDVIVPALHEVALQYPMAQEGITRCLDQAQTIHQQLEHLTRILAANSGVTKLMKGVGDNIDHESLIKQMLDSTYRGLVPIIYDADSPEVRRSPHRLLPTINATIERNAPKVAGTESLVDTVSGALTRGDETGALEMITQAIHELNPEPTRRKELP